jgi:chitinase
MGDFTRRVIGYYTNWRTSGDPSTTYLAPDIPWESLTHINYAFAHVDSDYTISVNAEVAGNVATDKTWPNYPGAEMDTTLPYTGHFNLLNKFKQQHPNVKTLVSVGGWAETGGHFGADGSRVNDGGFYTMTTKADGSVNTQGIEAFANSAVDFIRQYGFDGVDIDYEYPTSMNDAGNPLDFSVANAKRGSLNATYVELMRVLREKLDIAGEQDNTHYLLTIASPSSGYLLRGMETFQALKYLDYVNIMSYDLHGSWNQFVGPNAPLFDNGEDSELLTWNAYANQYRGIGYLNTDWAYHYMRGALQAGRINIGVPYYTRGWRDVKGGTNGLWGEAALPQQSNCPVGTGAGSTNKCGYGATGIDNLWHDVSKSGEEVGAGANPMWHAKNLEEGIYGSYLTSAYGFDPANPEHQLQGNYQRHYNSTMKTPWLWNDQKKVFLSTEDMQSIEAKTDYIIDQGIGGIMFWELAGDYRYNQSKGEYEMGSTLTDRIAEKFKAAPQYGNQRANGAMPNQALDVSVNLTGFKLGDSNYPISPELVITNNSNSSLPEGATLTFDVATSTGSNIAIQGGGGFDMRVLQDGENATGNNVGGLQYDFHRLELTLTKTVAPGASTSAKMKYYLPISTPSNWVISISGAEFALHEEYTELPVVMDITCQMMGIVPGDYPSYDGSGYGGTSAGAEVEYQNGIYRSTAWTSQPPTGSGWVNVCQF